MENSFIIERYYTFANALKVSSKIYFFLHAQSSRAINILREAFYNKTFFIKNQINESDYSI